jgi:hypothetical protein
MHAITDFSLTPLASSGNARPDRSQLRFEGRTIFGNLSGVVLEAQFQIDGDYLLLITEGSPFEEGLHIYLLSSGFDLLDEAELSAPYNPGIVTDLAVAGSRQLDFTFIGENRWRLTVDRKAHHSPADRYLRRPLRRWLRPKLLHVARLAPAGTGPAR